MQGTRLCWVTLVALTAGFSSAGAAGAPLPQPPATSQDAPKSPAAAQEPKGEKVSVTIERGPSGSFMTSVQINGKPVQAMIDTGATLVTIPYQIASNLGLLYGPPIRINTANGTISQYKTNLAKLVLGPIEMKNIDAVINPGSDADFILLGMSALQLLTMSQDSKAMVLSYDPAHPADPDEDVPTTANSEARFRRPLRECMGDDNLIDRKTLRCMEGR